MTTTTDRTADRLAVEADTRTTVLNGRKIADYVDLRNHLPHQHSTDLIVGYVVRETIGPNGEGALWRNAAGDRVEANDRAGRCGYDIAVVEGPGRYVNTRLIVADYEADGGYAVVDSLFVCGCRS